MSAGRSGKPFIPSANGIALWIVLAMTFLYAALQAADIIAMFADDSRAATLINRDFVNYWMSGRMARAGDIANLFPMDQYVEALNTAFPGQINEPRNWSYPPHFILLCLPFSFPPYPAAYLLFMAAGLVFWSFACVKAVNYFSPMTRISPLVKVLILLLPFIALQFLVGQNGFIFGGAFLLALVYRHDKPWVTGLMLAILTMKPHLGLLWPFLLIFERNWRAILWGAGFTSVLILSSIAAFGWASWQWFFTLTFEIQNDVAFEWSGVFLHMMPSWFAALRAFGIDGHVAIFVHLLIMAPLLAAAVWAMTRTDRFGRTLLIITATYTVLPYLFNYDIGPLLLLAVIGRVFATEGETLIDFPLVNLIQLCVVLLPIWMPPPSYADVGIWRFAVFLPVVVTTANLAMTIYALSGRPYQTQQPA